MIQLISEQTGIHKVDVRVILEAYFMEVQQALHQGEIVTASHFGTFMLKKRAAQRWHIVRYNIEVSIPEHYTPYFKPSKEFTTAIKSIPIKT